MFTGIVEEVGTVQEMCQHGPSARLSIHGPLVSTDLEQGHSVAINGVCLTVIEMDREEGLFTVDAAPETIRRTNLGTLHPGSAVNLERPLRLGDRIGGHLVTGHIDGPGRLVGIRPEENAIWLAVEVEPELSRYLVLKGSVAVDGISFTVASLRGSEFGVSVIPHTMQKTSLPYRQIGDRMNIEVDLIGKYVEKFLTADRSSGSLNRQTLERFGFG